MFSRIQRLAALAAFAVFAIGAAPAHAQATKVALGYIPVSDWLPAFVAKEKGMFDKRGLDVTMTKIAIISNIPPALMAGSLNIGTSTAPVLIDGVEAGLDLASIAGGSRFVKNPSIFSVVVRTGLDVKSAKDLEGKRVGVPGVRSAGDLLFRKWLLDRGVQPSKVNIVEASFPQMRDLVKGGTLDAVAVLEPFRSRMVSDQTGYRLADYVADVNPDVLGGVWIARREWLAAHPKAAQAFRDALTDAIDFIGKNADEAKAIEVKYTGFNTAFLPPYRVPVTEADFDFYTRTAREVGYLKNAVDASRLMAR
jgi:NitT/TauT family transport system substrate-binding protein